MTEQAGPGAVHATLWGHEPDRTAIDTSVAHWMQAYPILAVGNRPKDHMARDLMHGSLFRNHRLPQFSRLAMEPPDWLVEAVAHLPQNQRAQARQHLALRMMHGRGLYHLSGALPPGSETSTTVRSISHLLWCRPYGVHVARGDTEDSSPPGHDYTCKQARACPWCFGRWAMDYYRRLRRGPCRISQSLNKHLVMLRVEVTSDVLPPMPLAELAERSRAGERWMIVGADFNTRRRLLRREVDRVRSYFGGILRCLVRECGGVGGVMVHQIGPQLAGGGVCFSHDLSILAELPACSEEVMRFRAGRLGFDANEFRCVPHPSHPNPVIDVKALMMPAEDPQALRYLWAGTSVGFHPAAAGIVFNKGAYDTWDGDIKGAKRPPWGLDGAVRLPAWFLFDAEQWLSYRAVMAGRHLAAPFGTWKRQIRQLKPQTEYERHRSHERRRRAVIIRMRREEPLQRRNKLIEQTARAQRDRSFEVARPIYAELLLRSVRRPGRGQLRSAMAQAGFPISERVARDIIKTLGDQSDGPKSR